MRVTEINKCYNNNVRLNEVIVEAVCEAIGEYSLDENSTISERKIETSRCELIGDSVIDIWVEADVVLYHEQQQHTTRRTAITEIVFLRLYVEIGGMMEVDGEADYQYITLGDADLTRLASRVKTEIVRQ